jgi:galactose-1-phosphate uridylyltransferase
LNADVEVLPPWERAYLTDDWRLAHAWSSLAGYMILTPRRNVVAPTEHEAAALGPLLAATTSALRAVVGCEKTYVMLFAERQGFAHVHFHIVPRMRDLRKDHLGARHARVRESPRGGMGCYRRERARLAEEIGSHLKTRLSYLGSSR